MIYFLNSFSEELGCGAALLPFELACAWLILLTLAPGCSD